MYSGLSIIIPTQGRPELENAIKSVMYQDLQPGDEVIVIQDGPKKVADGILTRLHFPRVLDVRNLIHGPTRDFGNSQRNFAYQWVHNKWTIHLDDDDILCRDALIKVRKAIRRLERDRPLIFKLKAPWGEIIPRDTTIERGNVQTGCLVFPYVREGLIQWPRKQGGDINALNEAISHYGEPQWRSEIIQIARPLSDDIWW